MLDPGVVGVFEEAVLEPAQPAVEELGLGHDGVGPAVAGNVNEAGPAHLAEPRGQVGPNPWPGEGPPGRAVPQIRPAEDLGYAVAVNVRRRRAVAEEALLDQVLPPGLRRVVSGLVYEQPRQGAVDGRDDQLDGAVAVNVAGDHVMRPAGGEGVNRVPRPRPGQIGRRLVPTDHPLLVVRGGVDGVTGEDLRQTVAVDVGQRQPAMEPSLGRDAALEGLRPIPHQLARPADEHLDLAVAVDVAGDQAAAAVHRRIRVQQQKLPVALDRFHNVHVRSFLKMPFAPRLSPDGNGREDRAQVCPSAR